MIFFIFFCGSIFFTARGIDSVFYREVSALVKDYGYVFLLRITKAPITPGIQPQQVSRNTMSTEPHPRSITARGGKIIANKTCKQDIILLFLSCLHFIHAQRFVAPDTYSALSCAWDNEKLNCGVAYL